MAEKRLKALEKEINSMENGRIDIDHEKAKLIVKGQ